MCINSLCLPLYLVSSLLSPSPSLSLPLPPSPTLSHSIPTFPLPLPPSLTPFLPSSSLSLPLSLHSYPLPPSLPASISTAREPPTSQQGKGSLCQVGRFWSGGGSLGLQALLWSVLTPLPGMCKEGTVVSGMHRGLPEEVGHAQIAFLYYSIDRVRPPLEGCSTLPCVCLFVRLHCYT